MRRFLLIVLIGFIGSMNSTWGAENRPNGLNCNLQAPPLASGEEFNHGVVLKIFPRARDLPKNYTGCQSFWMPDKNSWAIISMVVIEQGDPVRIWSPHNLGSSSADGCRYKGGRVVQGDSSKCPSPEYLIMKSLPPGCVDKLKNSGGRFLPGCEYD